MLTYKEFITEAITKGKGKPKYNPPRASKTSFSIGDMVHLSAPINGMEWGTVSGFVLDKNKIKNANAPVAPLSGSKVASIMITLKNSPFNVVPASRAIEVDKSTLTNVSGTGETRAAMEAWRNLGLS